MLIKQIKHNSKEYKQSVNLRNQILHLPLGLKLNEKDLQKEKSDIHVAVFEKNKIIGILLLTPINKDTIRMRQVAIINQYQNRGIGSMLVKFAEKAAINNNFSKIILNSRSKAVNFYVKMGYQVLGGECIDKSINIPHYKMIKHIT